MTIRPRSVEGSATSYILSASGLGDVEQDTPSFNITFDRVYGLKSLCLCMFSVEKSDIFKVRGFGI